MTPAGPEFCAISATPEAARLRWLPASRAMTTDGFRAALLRLTGEIESSGATAIRIDLRDLGYRPTADDVAWRMAEIAPRWNRAGVQRLAYIVAGGAPGGSVPASRPGEDFLTRFCTGEDEAAAWLAQD